MLGRCVHNVGSNLGPPERCHFFTAETVFNVEVGKEYLVLGLGIFETVLLALVCDETAKPNWLPIGLFEFDSRALPSDWEFVLLDGRAASGGDATNRWIAKWGYAELVRDERHSDALIERDPQALGISSRELEKRASETA